MQLKNVTFSIITHPLSVEFFTAVKIDTAVFLGNDVSFGRDRPRDDPVVWCVWRGAGNWCLKAGQLDCYW